MFLTCYFHFMMFTSKALSWRSNFGGLKKLRRRSKDPNVINSKVYWCFEHKYIRRTVLSFCNNNPFTRSFSKLINPEEESGIFYFLSHVLGYRLSHELSLPGPFTGFIPVNEGLTQALPKLESSYKDAVVDFVRSHFTHHLWLHRDLLGSPTQPWLLYNKTRKFPKKLQTLNNKSLFFEHTGDLSKGDKEIFVNGSRILRWNMRCHNGVIHLIDKPLFDI
ncbi:uncharacterized protein TA11080 [Theileria annulata]|uniref:FAS1 domain-containing protein n=1 Tax=Theileria annulata TaxID=5874 RepID=Q4U8G6_THEAN|nr:uncharacterized protein TA11080 [Theileria annulata]CAI76887.1 hypothetical protein, conserved [Theileria annulata]|eukprot:XP_953512.1 hypothetical protein, conserved [Theileria annulata]